MLMTILKSYEKVSRLKVNISKSSIFFSKNILVARKQIILQDLGVTVNEGNGKYLGLPFLIGRTKRGTF